MTRNPRIHEIATEHGVDTKLTMQVLREMGEYFKGPSSSIPQPVARRLKKALDEYALSTDTPVAGRSTGTTRAAPQQPQPGKIGNPPAPPPVAAKPNVARPTVPRPERARGQDRVQLSPEDSRSRVRREIVLARGATWVTYGFSRSDQAEWLSGGLLEDQAKVAAMCRKYRARGWGITPQVLSTRLESGRTVQEEFELGTNVVSVLELVAKSKGIDLVPNFDKRLLTVIHGERPAGQTSDAPAPASFEATDVPALADHLQDRIRLSPAEAAADVFSRELIAFRRSGRVGPLLKLYAGAHGLLNDEDPLHRIAANVPLAMEEFRPNLSLIRLVHNATIDRQFYCSSPAATATSADEEFQLVGVPNASDLPSTTGFALLKSEAGSHKFVMWSHVAGSLTAALCESQDVVAGTISDVNVTTLPAGSAIGDSPAHRAVFALARNLRAPVLRSKGENDEPREHPAGTSARVTRARPTATLTVNDADEDYVALVYGPGEPRDRDQFMGARNAGKTDKRWLVRGHIRRQWYASKDAFIPIWIDAHESGAQDGIFITRDRVKIAR